MASSNRFRGTVNTARTPDTIRMGQASKGGNPKTVNPYKGKTSITGRDRSAKIQANMVLLRRERGPNEVLGKTAPRKIDKVKGSAGTAMGSFKPNVKSAGVNQFDIAAKNKEDKAKANKKSTSVTPYKKPSSLQEAVRRNLSDEYTREKVKSKLKPLFGRKKGK